MTFAFARISAVIAMRVEDYYPQGKRWWVRLHEKGGKRHEMPAHHNLEAYLDAYIDAAGIRDAGKSPLFRSATPFRSGRLTDKPMHRVDAYCMIQRRAAALGLRGSGATPSAQRGSRPISTMAAHWKMRSEWQRMRARARRSSMTAPGRNHSGRSGADPDLRPAASHELGLLSENRGPAGARPIAAPRPRLVPRT